VPGSNRAGEFKGLLMAASVGVMTLTATILFLTAAMLVCYSMMYDTVHFGIHLHLHYMSEVAFFLSGIGLFVLAVPGLFIASRHAKHVERQTILATRATQATAYESLFNKMVSDDIINGFRIITELTDSYSAYAGKAQTSLSKYAIMEMTEWLQNADPKSVDTIKLISAIENFGLLVRRGYTSMDDVYYIAEGPLKRVDSVWGPYLAESQANSPDGRECEHAIWLLNRIRDYEPEHGSLIL
jgi:hypothetical protein